MHGASVFGAGPCRLTGTGRAWPRALAAAVVGRRPTAGLVRAWPRPMGMVPGRGVSDREALGPSRRASPGAASRLPEPDRCRSHEPSASPRRRDSNRGSSPGGRFRGLLLRVSVGRRAADERVAPRRSDAVGPRYQGGPPPGFAANHPGAPARCSRPARLAGAALLAPASLTLVSPAQAQVTTFVTDFSRDETTTDTSTSRNRCFTAGSTPAGCNADGIRMRVRSGMHEAFLCAVGDNALPLANRDGLDSADPCVALTVPGLNTTCGRTPPSNTVLAPDTTTRIRRPVAAPGTWRTRIPMSATATSAAGLPRRQSAASNAGPHSSRDASASGPTGPLERNARHRPRRYREWSQGQHPAIPVSRCAMERPQANERETQ